MASVNRVILVGNLGADPDQRFLPNGDAVCNIKVATSESWKDKQTGDKKEATEWHRVVFWRRLADIAGQYLKKGSSVLVEGRIQTRSWEKDGKKNYRTEVIADNIQLGPRSQGGGGGARPADTGHSEAPPQDDAPSAGPGIDYPKDEINPEDIPF